VGGRVGGGGGGAGCGWRGEATCASMVEARVGRGRGRTTHCLIFRVGLGLKILFWLDPNLI
jgi:hypothetical protein